MPAFVRAERLFASGYLMLKIYIYLGIYGLIFPFDTTLIPSDTTFAPTFALI